MEKIICILYKKKIEEYFWRRVGKTEQGKPRLVLLALKKDVLLRSPR